MQLKTLEASGTQDVAMRQQVTREGSSDGEFPDPDTAEPASSVRAPTASIGNPVGSVREVSTFPGIEFRCISSLSPEHRSPTLAPPLSSTPGQSGGSTNVSPTAEAAASPAIPTAATAVPAAAPSGGNRASNLLKGKKRGGGEEGPKGPPAGEDGGKGVFGVTPAELAALTALYLSRTQYEELSALQQLGGVAGLARALHTDLTLGLPPFEDPPGPGSRRGSVVTTTPGDGSEGQDEEVLYPRDGGLLPARKQIFGENVLPQRAPTPFWRHCLDAASDFTLRVLMVAGLVMIILGVTMGEHPEVEWVEGFAIWVAVVVVVSVTALNDWGKEKQFRKLSKLRREAK